MGRWRVQVHTNLCYQTLRYHGIDVQGQPLPQSVENILQPIPFLSVAFCIGPSTREKLNGTRLID